ncbi:GerMN domain-containing protein [Okeania sp.]|uniref:GerMN domain-containing protein n=1 Tax=Okeania sp. TaxID=3100323 RepID=UPI002B4B0289|nr:GerMN domain-containing protein [Okeania sp.]MEB3341738.1 GerMN domain-containing protein [Okeania sp.]
MKEQNQTNKLSVGIVASVCALAVVVGGGIAVWTNLRSSTTNTSNNSLTPTTPSTQKSPDETLPSLTPVTPESPNSEKLPLPGQQEPKAVTEKTVELYWVNDSSGEISLVSSGVNITAVDEPEAILTAAFERLLSGPESADFVSAIPEGTKVQALTVEDNGVYIDLSKEFTSGGGSASMMGRLGQIIYTASSLDQNANVWIFVGGTPLEILGGDGLEVSQPITRQIFQQDFPLN